MRIKWVKWLSLTKCSTISYNFLYVLLNNRPLFFVAEKSKEYGFKQKRFIKTFGISRRGTSSKGYHYCCIEGQCLFMFLFVCLFVHQFIRSACVQLDHLQLVD